MLESDQIHWVSCKSYMAKRMRGWVQDEMRPTTTYHISKSYRQQMLRRQQFYVYLCFWCFGCK